MSGRDEGQVDGLAAEDADAAELAEITDERARRASMPAGSAQGYSLQVRVAPVGWARARQLAEDRAVKGQLSLLMQVALLCDLALLDEIEPLYKAKAHAGDPRWRALDEAARALWTEDETVLRAAVAKAAQRSEYALAIAETLARGERPRNWPAAAAATLLTTVDQEG